MKTTTHIFLLAAMIASGLAAKSASAEQSARYIVILTQGTTSTPDVASIGGTVEFRKGEELIVALPPDRLEALKAIPGIKYIQRVGPSDPMAAPIELPVEPVPAPPRMSHLGAAASALHPQPTGATPWNSGAYTYDGGGNVTRIGTQSFAYDPVQRLALTRIDGVSDTYTYDAFGNMTSKTIGGQAQSIPAPSSSTNRLAGLSYDERGNVTSDGAWSFTYDALGQALTESFGGLNSRRYVYTAGNERIGVLMNGWWFWSLRDENGHVLRQYRSVDGNPTVPLLWMEDFVWRDGLLLGGERPPEMGGRRHFHVDHLGTPRLITGDTGLAVSLHDYYPFGEEKTSVVQETYNGFDREDPMKFTGHERDFAGGQGAEDSHYIDYMHARYYASASSRFLSPDPLLGNLLTPQSWNRYTYTLNGPVTFTDPLGLEAKGGSPTDNKDLPECGPGVDGPCVVTVHAPPEPKPKKDPKPPDPVYLANVREFERFKAAALAKLYAFATRKDMPLYHGRFPDYVTLTLGANSQYMVGGGVQVTLDAYGRVYISPYGSVGTPGKGFALVAGWLRQNEAPGAEQLDSFISGFSGAGSIAQGLQYSYTYGGPGSGYADEAGVGFPGIGGSISYGFSVAQTSLKWR